MRKREEDRFRTSDSDAAVEIQRPFSEDAVREERKRARSFLTRRNRERGRQFTCREWPEKESKKEEITGAVAGIWKGGGWGVLLSVSLSRQIF